MKSLLVILVVSLGLSGCAGAFGDAADYFAGPVSGVGLKPATSIASGGTERLAAVVVPAKTANKRVLWSSSDQRVATVDESGLVSAVAVVGYGETKTATINATTEEGGYTAACVVTVTEKPVEVTAVTLNKNASYLVVADPGVEQLIATVFPADATNQTITWTSDAPAIVSVDSSGLVTAKQVGTGTITAASANGISATCTITVAEQPVPVEGLRLNKSSTVIGVGRTENLVPVITPVFATNQNVSWTTSNSAIATVNSLGMVSGIAASATPVIITATTTDGSTISASASVLVVSVPVDVTGVSLASTKTTITTGRQQEMIATIAPADATDQNMIWTTSAPGVARVDSGGLVTAIAPGAAVITVTTISGGFSASCTVTATALPTYSVTYDANGGIGSVPVDPNAYLPGAKATVLTGAGITNGAKTFMGWSDGVTTYQPGQSVTIGSADVTLTAVWYEQSYGVTYHANGGAGTVPVDSTSYFMNQPVTVKSNLGNALTRAGYVFDGWSETADGSGTIHETGASFTMPNKNVVLYAHWLQARQVITSRNAITIKVHHTTGIIVKAWGGGGGSGRYALIDNTGSQGGYVYSAASVNAGETIYICVGAGGTSVGGVPAAAGGNGGIPGGGGSVIAAWSDTANKFNLIACAGGGGVVRNAIGDPARANGGNNGAWVDSNGGNNAYNGGNGSGGQGRTTSTSGSGWNSGATTFDGLGGDGGQSSWDGSSGGGGYGGGGGGGTSGAILSSGGGGSFCMPNSSSYQIAGLGSSTTDPDYGANPLNTTPGAPGKDGLVVIYFLN